MSSTDSHEEHALAGSVPPEAPRVLGPEHPLHRSLATYRYENALVKTELAATLERHVQEVQELRLKFQAQIREVERQRSEAEQRLSEVQDSQNEQERKLHQTNLHLLQKIRVLEEDQVASTSAREKLLREKSQLEEDLQQLKFSQQSSEQTLQGENKKLREATGELQDQLDKERTRMHELTTALTTERHQHELIKSRVSEVEQHCQVQLTLAQAQAAQLRQERAQDEAAATKRITEVMSLVEEERALVVKVREGAMARQREAEKRMAEERQTHLSSIQQQAQQNTQLQQEVKTLEAKVRSLEEQQDSRGRELHREAREATEKLHQAEKEAVVARARVASLEGLEGQLRQEKESCSTLRQELHQHQAEMQELRAANTDLQHNLQQLNNKLSEARAQQEAAKEEALREKAGEARVLADLRASHQEEAEHLRARITTLESYLADKSAKYLEESGLLRQKLRTYGKLIKKLRHKLELGALQVEQLEAQRAALQDNVPAHMHTHLQTQLQALTRKHNEFAAFIRGLNEFQSSLPEIGELSGCVGVLGRRLTEMEEDQRRCFSDLESL